MKEFTTAENHTNNLYRILTTNYDISKLAGEIIANRAMPNKIYYLKEFASESKTA